MATNEHKSWRESREEILKRIDALEQANSALCDVVRYVADTKDIDWESATENDRFESRFDEMLSKARIPQATQNMTGGDWRPNQGANDDAIAVFKSLPTPLYDYTLSDKDISSLMSASAEELNGEEAQDETVKHLDEVGNIEASGERTAGSGECGVGGDTGRVDVGAIMGDMWSDFQNCSVVNGYDCAFKNSIKRAIEKVVRPIIERLVGERDSNLWKLKYDDMKNAKEREWAVAQDAIEAKERAEAERDAMKGCVDVLRRHIPRGGWNGWCSDKEQALAKLDEAQKGGA